MPGAGEVAVGRSSVLVGGEVYDDYERQPSQKDWLPKRERSRSVSLFTELDETEALRMYAKLLDKIPDTSHSGEKSFPIDSIRENV